MCVCVCLCLCDCCELATGRVTHAFTGRSVVGVGSGRGWAGERGCGGRAVARAGGGAKGACGRREREAERSGH